ncbi:MAG: biotin--[acetyl-CoA-carboxylase] ligase [Planctomycetota bacterium]
MNELERWQSRLSDRCAGATLVRRAVVVAKTASTMDDPATRDAPCGTVVATLRQTSGRGRLGRAWADTGLDGVAATFVVEPQPPERIALAGALAAARAVERSLGRRVGVKWPNDIVVDGRKLAGVLVERRGDRMNVGIGINVAQRGFDETLAARATSLAILGSAVDRLEVLCALVDALDAALVSSDGELVDEFVLRDALRGTRALFATPGGPVEGEVRSVDPMRGLVVRIDSGEVFLPAATTSVAEWATPSRR